MLSRQRAVIPLDYRLIESSLQKLDPDLPVVIRTTDSEKSGITQLVVHLIGQLWYASTSRVVILDGYNPVVCVPPKRSGVYVVQIWHAVGAIKKFGFQCLDTPAGRTTKNARLAHMHENYDVIIAGGTGAVSAYAEAFGYPKERVLPLGLPRMDHLLHASDRLTVQSELSRENPWIDNGNMNVLYAPTLRQEIEEGDWLYEAILNLSRALDGKPINLIVSVHPLMSIDASAPWPKNIRFIKGRSTESLLRFADLLITDYSAVGLEAGLVSTPAVFYCPDIETYRKSPGLAVDPLDTNALVGFVEADILASFIFDEDTFNSMSNDYKNFINSYFQEYDGNATTHIANLILNRCK